MWAARTTGPILRSGALSLRRRTRYENLPGRRTFVASTIQTLSDGFLDLAVALPYPPSFPAYSSTIILTTIITRLVFTLPFSLWAKKRQWRTEDVVIPILKSERPQIDKDVHQSMKRDRFRGDALEAREEFTKRAKPLLTARRNELLRIHRCTTLPTMLVPPITQLPLFVGLSMVLSKCAQAPTVLDSESFLTLTSLASSDPTATLPIVLGIITYANVESSRWFISTEAQEREKKVEEWNAAKRAKGHVVVEPRKAIQSGLRTMAIVRILIAAAIPGSVQIYWVTSALFGLIQSWAFDWWEVRRRQLRVTSPPDQPSPAVSLNTSTIAQSPAINPSVGSRRPSSTRPYKR